jgi:hypothetical protein
MGSAVVATSGDISTLAEAREYYRAKLARSHSIQCRDVTVEIVFDHDGTHLFSVEVDDIEAIPDSELVTRNIGGGKRECRQFSVERARMMDKVLPVISQFTCCYAGFGPPSRRNLVLHGYRLDCGRYMRVVLRPGPGRAWTCLSAFAVTEVAYIEARRAQPAKFPR